MLIAIASDIHDNKRNLRRAMAQAQAEGCSRLLFLGDVESPATFALLRSLWPHELDAVPGNNDYPRESFREFAAQHPQTHYHEGSADLLIDGRHIYMTHEPYNGVRFAAESGDYDLVLYGHTHRPHLERAGNTIVANPGDLQGRYGEPSFAVYDTSAHSLRHVPL